MKYHVYRLYCFALHPSESREQVEESLQGWRYSLKRRGMKVSKAKHKICVSERER